MLTAGAYIGGRTSRSTRIAVLSLVSIAIALLVLWAVAPSRASAVESGALSQLSEPFACIGEVNEEVAKCGKSVPSGLSYAYDVQVSPDGRSAYSVAVQGDLIEYSRNPANGSLSVIGCFSSKPKAEPACETNAEMEVASIESPAAVAISADGSSVYLIGQGGANDLVEFRRNPETGLLTKIGCVTEEATSTECTTGAKGLELPYGVTVSPDGENVYVTSFADQAIAEFKRDTKTGLLTQLTGENNCISDTAGSGCGTTTAIGLKEAIGVAVSPDGKDVYAGAGATSAEGDVAAFERGAEGALKQLHLEEGCISETVVGCSHAEHIQGTEDLVVSPDGNNVYGTSTATHSVVEVKRTGTGSLEQLGAPNECVTTEKSLAGCTEAKEIASPVGVAVAPDGSNVYVSSRSTNKSAVAAFARGPGGELTQLADNPCVTEAASGCEPAASNERTGLAYARRVTVSPDGTNVYVAAQSGHAIAELARAVTPTVTSLSNGGGVEAGGNEIAIEGGGFVEGATVEFVGAGSASEVHVDSASRITAVVPPGRGATYVVVTTAVGRSAVGAGSEYVYGRLGGLNIAGYCEGLGYLGNGSGATRLLREGQVEGPGYAYENWACVNGSGAAVPIAVHGLAPSMDNACAVAFPSVPSHANADNPDNAFSWTCYEGAPVEETKGGGGGPTTLPSLKKLASELVSLPIIIPPPVLAKTGNVAPVKGTVLVELPGTKTFVPLASLTQIPFGTVIEATNGTVSVTTANPDGTTQTGQFFGGQFILTQGKNGQVLAKLSGGNFSVCPTARERAHRARVSSRGPVAQTAASGKHVVRKLWANAHGKFSTEGNYAAGAVQGTEWLTEDLCEGTLIRVTRDKVAVTNLVKHKHVEVKTGHKYLAKAP